MTLFELFGKAGRKGVEFADQTCHTYLGIIKSDPTTSILVAQGYKLQEESGLNYEESRATLSTQTQLIPFPI